MARLEHFSHDSCSIDLKVIDTISTEVEKLTCHTLTMGNTHLLMGDLAWYLIQKVLKT